MPSRPSLKGQKVSVSTATPIAAASGTGSAAFVTERFELQHLLGEGGMGHVFVAQDRGLGRVVALKRLRGEFESDKSALRRFVLEAQIGAQLEHPNIVPLYSFERTDGGSPAIAMQLLEGQTMAEYIKDAATAAPEERAPGGRFALKERIGNLLGCCDAIHFAHERGVIHRDLKPENVMLGRFREVYVMDWGLARVIGSEDVQGNGSEPTAATTALESDVSPEALGGMPTIVSQSPAIPDAGAAALQTQQGQVMGTPQYMPPEQALGRIDQIGPGADQYALGIMLFELSTLVPARSHTNLMQAFSQAVQGHRAEAIDVDGGALHPALAAIVARATEAAPNARYPSVLALANDLRSFIRDEPVSVFAEGSARRLVRWASRRPALAMGVLTGVIVLAACAVITSLVQSAAQAKKRAHDLEGSRRLLVAVSGRAQALDVELSDLAAGVQLVAGATVQRLELEGASLPFRPAPTLTPSAAFGGAAMSFDSAVVMWPHIELGAPAPPDAPKLVGLEPWLKRALWDALPPAERSLPGTGRDAALLAGHSALLRCFVGLEDGSFVQFPARGTTLEADPRQRPWYQAAAASSALQWTRPVVDVAGKTLRMQATVGLFGSSGKFLGIAGCDLRVSKLARQLTLPLPGFQRAYLVTEDGKIAVSEDLEARVLGATRNVNFEVNLPAVDNQALAARIAAHEHGGYLETADGKLIVYSRLISPPWTYVAELDRAPYMSR